jgi:phosphate transport system ATP-binding protein
MGARPEAIREEQKDLEFETRNNSQAQVGTTFGEAFVHISHLNVYYNDLHVLKDISLDIREKEITVIMGPSGCGKSTLIRVLNRMNDGIPGFRFSGKVIMDGIDIYSKAVDPVLLKMRVGMVFQKPNPFPISIYDNVAFGPRIHKLFRNKQELDAIVKESLERAALWDEVKNRLKENAMKLSGGQQQRLCIARALAVKPEVLLLDEPASALDPGSSSKIEELMVDLKKNFTVVLVTHNMQQAARVANNVAFLYKGELVEIGRSAEIFENPKHELTEKYISGRLV